MKLALRRAAADDATWLQRAFACLTRWRLCSVYAHAGIVIGDRLFQVNAKSGLHESTYTPERWDLFELGDSLDADALELFDALRGAGYDYLGVLGFGLPVQGDDERLYCFEWCALAMGMQHQRWMTPEKLLIAALGMTDRAVDDFFLSVKDGEGGA